MNYETIKVQLTDDVQIVIMNRPDVMNALNTQMRAEITHAVKEGGDVARCVVLTGEGRAFCSGQDLGDRANMDDIDLERTLREEYEPMLRAIFNCRAPTISAVNGAAAGAGANLALAADIVIASEDASFLQAFSRIGLIPDAGGTYWLPRQIGFARAMGAAFFAERISARQAAEWGMIWEVAPDEEFHKHWWNRAVQLATGPTESYRGIKRAMRETFNNTLDAQLDLEAGIQGNCGRTRDFREGVVAFREKRKPAYEGR